MIYFHTAYNVKRRNIASIKGFSEGVRFATIQVRTPKAIFGFSQKNK